jgi:hypothetical protein
MNRDKAIEAGARALRAALTRHSAPASPGSEWRSLAAAAIDAAAPHITGEPVGYAVAVDGDGSDLALAHDRDTALRAATLFRQGTSKRAVAVALIPVDEP